MKAQTEKLKIERGSGNVFADIGFSPAEAENLRLRTDLMIALLRWFEASGLTQVAAAKRLGVTQPRLNAILRNRIDDCSLDWLVGVAATAGLKVKLTVTRSRRAA